MSHISFASHPFLLGFEQLDELVERSTKADGYPPFNIEQHDADSYRITLAVAGFAERDLTITLENGRLTIRGKQADDGVERVFLHRGIAARQFQRSFALANRVEVVEARLDHGLLQIDLVRRQPDAVIQTIRIGSGKGTVGKDGLGKGEAGKVGAKVGAGA